MNSKRSLYNVVVGIGSQILSIALGIIIPRLFLVNYGSEVNGFLNTITQIFAYFALLEAGVGAATLQALYRPVGAGDRQEINGILAATDRYYRRTGKIYLVAVLILSVVYPLCVSSQIPLHTMILIVLFNGVPGVISYYYQGKLVLLLNAEGKNYIITALTSIASTAISVLKILLMLLGCDILAVQAAYLVINLIKIFVIYLYIRKHYKWLDMKVEPNLAAIEQKDAAFVNQICDLIFRNTDTIILSLFCDLKVVSVYAMYTLFYSMVRTALDYVAQGFAFVMGQTFNNNRERFIKIHDLYESYRMALCFALYNIAFVFMLPFMRLYTAGITDVVYIDGNVSLLFVIYYLLTAARACASDVIGYAQHFRKTQGRCILEAAINLTVSLVGVYFLGIYGVLIGTIVALIYRMNDMLIYANRKILNRSPWVSYKRVITNALVFVGISVVASYLPWNLDSYGTIIGWAAVFGIVTCALYFVAASVTNRKEFAMLMGYVKPFVRKMLHK